MIKLTENAVKHLSELKAKHNVKYIRLEVKGGGCAGYEYKWSFENEINEIDDLIIGDLVVDSMFEMSLQICLYIKKKSLVVNSYSKSK